MHIIEIINTFKTQEDCIAFLESKRWKDGVVCPYCKSDKTCKHLKRHQCWNCNKSFSVTTKTIFHATKLPLQKWLLAIALISDAKKGISSRQIARHLSVHVETAWSLAMRIRKAMNQNNTDLFAGIVEMDETYVKVDDKDDDDKKGGRGRGSKGNVPIIGIKEKKGDVKAKVANDVKFDTLIEFAKFNVKLGGELHTDQFRSYWKFKRHFTHKTVNHAKEFVSVDNITTNGVEGFWSLLKRGVKGNFHHISLKYLQRYIDEFVWKYNNRGCGQGEVFGLVVDRLLVL